MAIAVEVAKTMGAKLAGLRRPVLLFKEKVDSKNMPNLWELLEETKRYCIKERKKILQQLRKKRS